MIKMDALVVVHAEKRYIDAEEISDPEQLELNKKVITGIAEAVERFANKGSAYFLVDTDINAVPEEINRHSEKITFIPPYESAEHVYMAQLLKLKEQLLCEGVERAFIAGFSYYDCVTEIYNLLLGSRHTDSDIADFASLYTLVAKTQLSWPKKKFESVFGGCIEARVLEELTDKCVNEKPFNQHLLIF